MQILWLFWTPPLPYMVLTPCFRNVFNVTVQWGLLSILGSYFETAATGGTGRWVCCDLHARGRSKGLILFNNPSPFLADLSKHPGVCQEETKLATVDHWWFYISFSMTSFVLLWVPWKSHSLAGTVELHTEEGVRRQREKPFPSLQKHQGYLRFNCDGERQALYVYIQVL